MEHTPRVRSRLGWFAEYGSYRGHSALTSGGGSSVSIRPVETEKDPAPVKILVRNGQPLSTPEIVFPPKASHGTARSRR